MSQVKRSSSHNLFDSETHPIVSKKSAIRENISCNFCLDFRTFFELDRHIVADRHRRELQIRTEEYSRMVYVTSFERFAREIGLEEGRAQGSAIVLLRILSKKCGVLTEEIQTSIRGLKLEQSENLGEALLDFQSVDDLRDWLISNHQ